MKDVEVGQRIIDIYGNEGTVINVVYDYVRLDNGKHVYKTAIQRIVRE